MNSIDTVVPEISQSKSAASAPPRVQLNELPVSVSVIVPSSTDVSTPMFSSTLIASSESAAW